MGTGFKEYVTSELVNCRERPLLQHKKGKQESQLQTIVMRSAMICPIPRKPLARLGQAVERGTGSADARLDRRGLLDRRISAARGPPMPVSSTAASLAAGSVRHEGRRCLFHPPQPPWLPDQHGAGLPTPVSSFTASLAAGSVRRRGHRCPSRPPRPPWLPDQCGTRAADACFIHRGLLGYRISAGRGCRGPSRPSRPPGPTVQRILRRSELVL
ncbi:hypothetical protein EVAR_94493_1 [Eumeta japonica]|uniref:Uncharacterized protein n=1 Tax=Eumeta variegata TaxID=151549 RepID=A0A4C1UUS5_EUMVA|nr:hypothetical protein EVAR_94493_1 [Eumeta japonica]